MIKGLAAATAGLLAVAMPAGSPARAQAAIAAADVLRAGEAGSLVHGASRFVFPAALGGIPRRKITFFATDNVAAQYTLRGGGNGDAWFDLFIYPASLPVDEEARSVEASLVQSLKAVSVVAPVPIPAAARDGKSGWFQGRLNERSMTSGYILVQRGKWFIKLRASIPAEARDDAIARFSRAVEAIAWDWCGEVLQSRSSGVRSFAVVE